MPDDKENEPTTNKEGYSEDEHEDKNSEGDSEGSSGSDSDGADTSEKEEVTPQVKKLRRENARKRVEIKELRDKLAKVEAEKSDDGAKSGDRSQPRDKTLLEIMNKRLIRSELKAAVLKAGIVDMDAVKMFDISSLEVNEDGDVVGIDDLIDEMREAKDYLFNKEAKDTTSNKKTPGDATSPKSKSALDMSDDEFIAGAKELGIHSADFLL